MLQLIATVLEASTNNVTAFKTGVITRVTKVALLNKSGGDIEVINLRIDESTADFWNKAKGRDIAIEVEVWAMANEKTLEVSKGYFIQDKKTLPSLIRMPVAAAA